MCSKFPPRKYNRIHSKTIRSTWQTILRQPENTSLIRRSRFASDFRLSKGVWLREGNVIFPEALRAFFAQDQYLGVIRPHLCQILASQTTASNPKVSQFNGCPLGRPRVWQARLQRARGNYMLLFNGGKAMFRACAKLFLLKLENCEVGVFSKLMVGMLDFVV